MGVPDAASAATGAPKGPTEAEPLKLLVPVPGDAQAGGEGAAMAPLSSPTWTDRDDRSGRTETTSAASDYEDGSEGVGSGAHAEGGADAARDFRELLRSMQRQLAFLQSMTERISREERAAACVEKGGGKLHSRALSSSPSTARDPAEGPQTCQSGEVTSLSLGEADAPAPVDEPEAESAIDRDTPEQEMRALQVEVQWLRAELEATQHENARLASVIQRLEISSGARDTGGERPEDAGDSSNRPLEVVSVQHVASEQGEAEPRDAVLEDAMLAGNAFLDAESPQWLIGHEACQRRTHELWETVRTLALYVRTYSLEKAAMRLQRDDAVREAELAWAQNAALAGSSNPHQKIKYLQQLKADNGALRKSVRELQTLLVEQRVAGVASSSSSPADASDEALEPSASAETEAPSSPTSGRLRRRSLSGAATLLEEAGDRYERKRNAVLARMWRRQEELRAQVARLKQQQQQQQTLDAPAEASDALTPRSSGGGGSSAEASSLSPAALRASPGPSSRGARARRRDARAAASARIAH